MPPDVISERPSSDKTIKEVRIATQRTYAVAPSWELVESAGGKLGRLHLAATGVLTLETNDGIGGGWVAAAGFGGGGGGSGDVVGPASAVDEEIPVFDTTTGKLLKAGTDCFITAAGTIFNESGADVDFRIESSVDANSFFLDGLTGNVGIGTASPVEELHVEGRMMANILSNTGGWTYGFGIASGNGVLFVDDNVDVTVANAFARLSNSSGAGQFFLDDNGTLNIQFKANGNSFIKNDIFIVGDSAANGTSEFQVAGDVFVRDNLGINTNAPGAAFDCDGDAVFNESGADVDFRIESSVNANQFVLDGLTGQVLIGGVTIEDDGTTEFGDGSATRLHSGVGSNRGSVEVSWPRIQTAVDGQNRPVTFGNNLYLDDTGAYAKQDSIIGGAAILVGSSNGGTGGFTFVGLTDTDDATVTTIEYVRIGSTEIAINEDGADRDFRIESSVDANTLFVDGLTGEVGIGTATPDEKLEVVGAIKSDQTALGDVLDYFFIGQTENTSEAIKIGFNASGGNHFWTEIETIGHADTSGIRNRSMRFNCRTSMDTATSGHSAVFVVNGEHYTAAATLVNAKLLACTNADVEVFGVGPTGLVTATGLNIGRVANNTVTGTYASVTSGQYNTAAGDYSTAAGDENEANGDYSGTLSGEDCVNDGPHSVIAGGSHNTISTGSYDAILGGWSCNITGTTGNNVVCGGSNNEINGTRRNFMGGGYYNEISAQEYNTLVGGQQNEVSGTHSFIGGGGSNLSSSNTGGVGWGNSNVCSGERAGVVCGTSNTASDKWTFIGGGTLNTASQDNAAICGGRDNTSTNYGTFVGGGMNNDATTSHASICGGELNVASGDGSHIGGGHSNAASGVDACVPGGLSNTAATSYSTAIGTESVTRNKGELTQSSGSFSTAGDTQVRRLHLRRETTDATPTILTDDNAADSAGSWNCAYKTLQHYKVTVEGHRTDDTEFASFTMEGTVHRPSTGNPTSLWDSLESWVQSSAAWDAYMSVGSGGVKLYVVGEDEKNINWSASVELVDSTVP